MTSTRPPVAGAGTRPGPPRLVGAKLFIGLISGTSADGIDAALVRFDDDTDTSRCELLLGRTYPWTADLRERLVALGQGADVRLIEELGTLAAGGDVAAAEIGDRGNAGALGDDVAIA